MYQLPLVSPRSVLLIDVPEIFRPSFASTVVKLSRLLLATRSFAPSHLRRSRKYLFSLTFPIENRNVGLTLLSIRSVPPRICPANRVIGVFCLGVGRANLIYLREIVFRKLEKLRRERFSPSMPLLRVIARLGDV